MIIDWTMRSSFQRGRVSTVTVPSVSLEEKTRILKYETLFSYLVLPRVTDMEPLFRIIWDEPSSYGMSGISIPRESLM